MLRERTGASTIEGYLATGARYADLVHRATERGGRRLTPGDAVLDFGCGSGRALQHLLAEDGLELFGCDIHAPSVRWMQENLPGVRADVSSFRPPLPYEDDRFDCVYAWSVFSHIDEETQRQWLSELGRVLAPDGVLLISILSEASELAVTRYVPSLDCSRVPAENVVFVPYADEGGVRSEEYVPTDQPYGLTFVSRAHVRASWNGDLEVIEIMPLALESIQDVVILRPSA